MTGLRRAALLVAANVGVFCLLVLLLEGGASLLMRSTDEAATSPLAERLHTRFDTTLGWVNEPGVHHPDMYGDGVALSINPQGFRGTAPTPPQAPPGITRVVCSGDSFTLGYGVSDTDTWCHRLALLDSRLETVNMGQGGYGFDQAFLWYRRDGMALEHRVQVFAFISDDFRRMQDDQFLGNAKPLLRLGPDSLVVTAVPSPRRRGAVPAFLARFADPLDSLRSVQLIRRLRHGGGDGPATGGDTERDAQVRARIRPVVARAIADLAAWHRANGSSLLLVHLPTSYELEGHFDDIAREWGRHVADLAAEHAVGFLDLFPEFERLPATEREAMFIGADEVQFPAAAGHYTVAGNAMVAVAVHAALLANGMIAALPSP